MKVCNAVAVVGTSFVSQLWLSSVPCMTGSGQAVGFYFLSDAYIEMPPGQWKKRGKNASSLFVFGAGSKD